MTQKEQRENLHCSVSIRRNLMYTKKTPGPDDFSGKLYQTF